MLTGCELCGGRTLQCVYACCMCDKEQGILFTVGGFVCARASVLSSPCVYTHQPSVAVLWQVSCWFGPAWFGGRSLRRLMRNHWQAKAHLAVTWLVACLLAPTLPTRRTMIPNCVAIICCG